MAETLKDFLVGVKFETQGADQANQAISTLDGIVRQLGEVLMQAASAFQGMIGQMQSGKGAVEETSVSMQKGSESAGQMEKSLRKVNNEGRLTSLKQGKSNVHELERAMKKASSSILKYAKMAVGYLVGSNIVNTFKSVMEFNEGLAKSAKDLKKTVEQTRAYNLALQVMGKTAKEIEQNKSLKTTFENLQKIGNSLALPEAAAGIRNIGAVKDSLMELKMVGSYALQWIYYKVQEVAAGPLARTREILGSVRDWFSGNIKNIAEGFGKAFSWALQIINSVATAIGKVIGWIDKLPPSIKIAGAAAIAVIAAVRSKTALITMIISAILLLIDDFVTYMQGGDSLFGDFWGKLIEWVEKARPIIEEFIGYFDAGLQAVGEAINWLCDLLGTDTVVAIGLVGVALWALSANPIVLIIAAVIGLITGLGWLVKNWDKVKEAAIACWDAIKEWCVNAWHSVEEAWGAVVAWFADIWNNLKAATEPIWNEIKGFAVSAWDGIKEVWNAVTGWFSDLFSDIPAFASEAWEKIKAAFSAVGSWFSNNVVTPIKNAFNGIGEWFSTTFSEAWKAVEDIFGKVGEWAAGIWNGISEGIAKAADWVSGAAKDAGAWITQAGVDVGDFFKNGWNSIFGGPEQEPITVEVDTEPVENAQTEMEAFQAAIESLADSTKLQEWYTEQFGSITQIVQEAAAAVESAMQAIKTALDTVPENAVAAKFNRIRSSIQRSMSASASAVSRQVAAIKASLASIPSNINVTVGTTIVQRYKTALSALGGAADAQATPGYAFGSTVNNIRNSTSSNTVSAPATINVFGTDAKSTAKQVSANQVSLVQRNLKALVQ